MGEDNSVVTFAQNPSDICSEFPSMGLGLRERTNPKSVGSGFKKRRAGKSNAFNEDDYDFALVLSPSADYSLWANELDFFDEKIGNTNDFLEEADELLLGPSSVLDAKGVKQFLHRPSVFEQALENQEPEQQKQDTQDNEFTSPQFSRKWGNGRDIHNDGKLRSLTSPPVLQSPPSQNTIASSSVTPTFLHSDGTPMSLVEIARERKRQAETKLSTHQTPPLSFQSTTVSTGTATTNGVPLAQEVIPRGLASRQTGLQAFLAAMSQGLILKRHGAKSSGMYIKIYSEDGCDTIMYKPCREGGCEFALKEQALRYSAGNGPKTAFGSSTKGGSNGSLSSSGSGEFLPAHQITHTNPSLFQRAASKVAEKANLLIYSGSISVRSISAVHPARNEDPYSKGQKGTKGLRGSNSSYNIARSFSLILRSKNNKLQSTHQHSNGGISDWGSGGTSDASYRTFDLEAETEGEYWLIFRGFLQLQRDAQNGRFAGDRRGGMGSHYSAGELEKKEHEEAEKTISGSGLKKRIIGGEEDGESDDDEVDDEDNGKDKSRLSKLSSFLSSWRKSSGYTTSNPPPAPPPADYFLGFKSPGTQIWARLRQAGLETKRVYALDTRRVMIKLRCSEERLEDVAEVRAPALELLFI